LTVLGVGFARRRLAPRGCAGRLREHGRHTHALRLAGGSQAVKPAARYGAISAPRIVTARRLCAKWRASAPPP
jgi:hypothetical protein